MTHKLLVITAGTIAAGVGLEFSKQVKAHPACELQPVVRYIDTAHLPTRYSGLRSGEWFQMTINPQFMDTIRRNQENYPYLKELLYPGFLPEIQGSGGGSIRYNAAGAIAINRVRMKDWLTTSITDLVKSGGGQVDLSIALVVSAVGATGSGTLERLVDMIVDCSQTASIPSPLHLDVFLPCTLMCLSCNQGCRASPIWVCPIRWHYMLKWLLRGSPEIIVGVKAIEGARSWLDGAVNATWLP